MNAPYRLVEADTLALSAAPPDPTDDTPTLVWLDLVECRKAVAISSLQTVVRLIAPQLFLHDQTKLVVATGELDLDQAALIAAEAIEHSARTGIQLAVVRGEDITPRLEELAIRGADLRDEQSGLGLIDESKAPHLVLAPANAATLKDALQESSIVISRAATRDAVEQAIGKSDDGDGSIQSVRAWMPSGFGLQANFVMREGRKPEEATAAIKRMSLSSHIELRTSAHDDSLMLHMACDELASLVEAARRAELAISALGVRLPMPLKSWIEPRYTLRQSRIPAELLEYRFDRRSASDWLG